ncbi:unnamed protein product [Trifolium pratense]|uniref:Uncharacterized protein n=1 Tax=Trifolium pratense TaxID=57577 RepID=A0ACB0KX51_TRIPR|nr:unnamed protein product [Trifolium pratense]
MDLESSEDSLTTKTCKCRDCNCECGCSKRTTNWIRSVKRKHDDVVHVEIGDESVSLLTQAVSGHQKAIEDLYSELEEERNAASSAANETMSMILRLQTEKAELEMEARQFKRFVEERACYDEQEILALEELLDKREQTIHLLTCEIQAYKHRLMSNGLSTELELEGDYEYPPLKCNIMNAVTDTDTNNNENVFDVDVVGTKNIIEKIIVAQSPRTNNSMKFSCHSSSFVLNSPRFNGSIKKMNNGSENFLSFKNMDSVCEASGYDDEHVTTPRELGNQGDFEDPSAKKFYLKLHAISMLLLNASTMILIVLLSIYLIRTWTKR